MKESEDVTRRAVRLVLAPLKNIDFSKFKVKKQSFLHEIISYAKRIVMENIKKNLMNL